ncbi:MULTISPECIES: hypothetical protein [Fictibacillus]|uniref:hypothetical protein n=1 Tax=Fictibacillus TaxID=1329200 RepID=UPI0018CDDAF4|nr:MULTISPECIES: hypothetical protein [unclassified Fictibacillus]MBH0161440.1 hypothetical protein [Fictibacillus sp. 26RED30]MBH0164793.1 hypothetical protein [Fictibacillus sp. 7GRE50]
MRLLRDRRTAETLKSETYECGSASAPWKASSLERKSTLPKATKLTKTAFSNDAKSIVKDL